MIGNNRSIMILIIATLLLGGLGIIQNVYRLNFGGEVYIAFAGLIFMSSFMFFRPKKGDPFEEARAKMEKRKAEEEEQKRNKDLLDI